jgi:hypothetical protein
MTLRIASLHFEIGTFPRAAPVNEPWGWLFQICRYRGYIYFSFLRALPVIVARDKPVKEGDD